MDVLALHYKESLTNMTMKRPSIEDIADWFLMKEPVTHKKLQKLCYYAIAWSWALMDKSIVSNDEFQAWVHGPVSPVLWKKYTGNGWNIIPKPESTMEMPSDVQELLESVWITYGAKSGNELEALSHAELPWRKARQGASNNAQLTTSIDTGVMKAFYNSIKSTDY
jgi:uncharacterized phage-associated protein